MGDLGVSEICGVARTGFHMSNVLPVGVSPERFEQALARFRKALGAEWVFAEEGPRLTSYNDRYPMRDPQLHAPSAAIAPKSVAEIQTVLAIASEYGIPSRRSPLDATSSMEARRLVRLERSSSI